MTRKLSASIKKSKAKQRTLKMKKILIYIQFLQGLIIDNFFEGCLKQGISKIAGIDCGGKIGQEDYGKIKKSLNEFKEIRRRYKGDKTKIVLNKNLLLNVFKNIGEHFVFRSVNENGVFHLETMPTLQIAINGYSNIIYSPVFSVFVCIALAGFYDLSPGMLGFAFILSYAAYNALIKVALIITQKRWQTRLQNAPHFLFKDRITTDNESIYVNKIFYCYNKSQEIYLTVQKSDRLHEWHKEVIEHLCSLSEHNPKIGWLWKKSTITWELDSKKKQLHATIDADYAVPFLETENAFIFYFPDSEKWNQEYETNPYFDNGFMMDDISLKLKTMFEEKNQKLFI